MKTVLFKHYAICWNCLVSTISTLYVSRFNNRLKSNKEIGVVRPVGVIKQHPRGAQSAGNQRQYSTSLVETSETTRVAPYPRPFCEWLSGIIDGNGSLFLSKQGYTSLEIIMSIEDLPLLQFIKTKLGGSIKMRSNAKAYRYRLHNKEGMLNLLSCINGNIRHSSRLHQLHRVCTALKISCQLPILLDKDSHWFAGFFDAVGSINHFYERSDKSAGPQLNITVTNRLIQDIQIYKDTFGGSIFYNTSKNGYYSWSIQNREDILNFFKYFESHPFRSQKARRFFLIHEYYLLYDRKAYSLTNPHYKEWAFFLNRWNQRTDI